MFSEDSPMIQKLEKLNYHLDQLTILKVLTEGLTMILPIIIVGAFSALLANFPWPAYTAFIEENGIRGMLNLGSQFTTNVVALAAVISITHNYVKGSEYPTIIPSMIALLAFLIMTPLESVEVAGEEASVLTFDWLGSAGFFVGILTALLVGKVYVLMMDNNWTLKMPESVPEMVSNSFKGMIPALIILFGAMVVSFLMGLTTFGSVHQVIFDFLQAPLTNLGNSIWALALITLLSRLLWMIGIHGMLVLMPILLTVFMPLDIANLEAYNAGQPLPNIIGLGFWILTTSIGGGGATLGLNILMAFKAKSERYRKLGKVALPAGIFGINEPLIFGLPIVLNPMYAIPYIFVPLINLFIGYGVIATGLLPAPNGASILGMPIPVFFTGLVLGSVGLGLLQVGLLALDTAIYYPFFRAEDKKFFKEEQELAKEKDMKQSASEKTKAVPTSPSTKKV